MPSELDIKIAGVSLDLFDNEEKNFYLTKQIHDLVNLETRDASFSKTISVPLTSRNIQILEDNLPTVFRFTTAPIQYLSAEVLVKGVPVLEDAYALVKEQTKKGRTVNITVIGGTARFFNQLREEPISSLNFAELDLDWSLAGIIPIVEGGGNDPLFPKLGIQYCKSFWYSNKSRRLYDSQDGNDLETKLTSPELGESGFLMYFKTVLDKIFSNLVDLEVDDSALLALTDYTDTGFFVPVPIVHDSFGAIEGTYTEVQLNVLQDLTARSQIIVYPDIIKNDELLWNPLTNMMEFLADGFYNITCYCKFDSFFEGAGTTIYVYKNIAGEGGVVGGLAYFDTQLEGTISTSVNVVAGDTVFIATNWQFPPASGNLIESIFTVEAQGTGRGRELQVSSVLPEINQKTFVKEIFKLLNIMVVEKNKKIILSLFEDIPNNEVQEIEFNQELETTYLGSFASYGQTNHFKYKENEAVERSDFNTTFPVLDNTLPANVDKIISDFSATDFSAVTGATDTLVIPNYELEYQFVTDNKITFATGSTNFSTFERNDIKAGDFIAIPAEGRYRVISMVSDFAGVVDVPFPSSQNDRDWYLWRYEQNDVMLHIGKAIYGFTGLNVQDGGNEAGYTWYSKVNFDDLLWNNLKTKYYTLLVNSMYRPFIVIGWCSFGVLKYISLDGLQPIYVKEYQAYFYANKIEQWKYNGSTRVELIKLEY